MSDYRYLKFVMGFANLGTMNGANIMEISFLDDNNSAYLYDTGALSVTGDFDSFSERITNAFNNSLGTDSDMASYALTGETLTIILDLGSNNGINLSVYSKLKVNAYYVGMDFGIGISTGVCNSLTVYASDDGSEYTQILNETGSPYIPNTYVDSTERYADTYNLTVPAPPVQRSVSKVIFGNQTLIDLTSDTVTADKLLSGYTAHGADGEAITGTAIKIVVTEDDTTPPADTNALWVYPDTMQDLSEVQF